MNPDQPTPQLPKPRKVRTVPQDAPALSQVLDLAAAEWQKRPQLTLAWITQPEAQALADGLRQGLRATGAARDALAPQTQRFDQLDALIDGPTGKLKYLRKALALQYDEENDGRAYYGEFGIVKAGSTYTLPHDRDERAEALTKLVAALPRHALDQGKYGLSYWQPLATEYNDLQPRAARATGTRAAEVGGKNQLLDQGRAFLTALLLLLEANYPASHKAERRQFGFLKESY